MQRWPFWFFVAQGLVPSALFSIGNLEFNSRNFIEREGIDPRLGVYFNNVEVLPVNIVSFGLAITVVFRFAWPVLLAVRNLVHRKPVDPESLPAIRRRALWIGDCAGWFGMSLWVLSGIVFPGWLNLRFGSHPQIDSQLYINFIASQIACGGISSTLTFFLLTYMCVRAFYPVLIVPGQSCPEEVENLVRLERRCNRTLILAGFFAFFAMLLLAFWMTSVKPLETSVQLWMMGLSGIGAASCYFAYLALQKIRGDLQYIAIALDPGRESQMSSSTESVDSFWTGTR
jgi:hypothetical protein